jgi:hypothetical protein
VYVVWVVAKGCHGLSWVGTNCQYTRLPPHLQPRRLWFPMRGGAVCVVWCIVWTVQVERGPRPLLYALIRSLHVLSMTSEGGATTGPVLPLSVHPLSSSGDALAVAGDAGVGTAGADRREEGRVWEGPWSATDRALMATLTAPVKGDMALLRRVATLALSVQVAAVVR